MGTYTRHVIKIINCKDEETFLEETNNLKGIMKEITNSYVDESWLREDNSFDDRSWNGGDGSKWYDFCSDIEKISAALGEVDLYTWTHCESGHEDETIYRNGEIISDVQLHGYSRYYDDWVHDDKNEYPRGFGILMEKSLKEEIVGDEDARFEDKLADSLRNQPKTKTEETEIVEIPSEFIMKEVSFDPICL